MKKQKHIRISEAHEIKAKKISKKLLGKENVSGAIAYLIEKEKLT